MFTMLRLTCHKCWSCSKSSIGNLPIRLIPRQTWPRHVFGTWCIVQSMRTTLQGGQPLNVVEAKRNANPKWEVFMAQISAGRAHEGTRATFSRYDSGNRWLRSSRCPPDLKQDYGPQSSRYPRNWRALNSMPSLLKNRSIDRWSAWSLV